MKSSKQNPYLLSAMAAALALVYGSAAAQDNDITQLTKPESTVDVGVSYVDNNNQRFGEYTGLTREGAYGIVDFSLLKRDDATGTWFSLQGRNLGYEDREVRLEQKRQGDWGYFVDYSRIPRYEPLTVNTGLQGVATTSQTSALVAPGTGSNDYLKTVRDRWTLGLQKAAGAWDFSVRYRNEVKDGSRLYGQGTFSTWRFLTDVIDQTTQQIDAVASYNTKRFQLAAGYYGTAFDNHNSAISVATTAPLSTVFPQMTLPPGNQSHQLYVTGGYNFTQTTRGDFKLAYARATQDDSWPNTTGTAPGVPGNLDARVDTTLLQGGLSGRVTPKFSWRADLRYQDRDDKTPVVAYWPTAAGAATTANELYNQPHSLKQTTGKVEGHYSLPMNFRLTGDVTYDEKKRNVPDVTIVNFRERVDETTYRIELRRAVSQTVTGAIAYLHSKRDGSDWIPLVGRNDVTPQASSVIAPLNLANRDRDTGRLTLNWIATENLSFNFRADESRDEYTDLGAVTQGYDVGPRKGRGSNYSLDAAYAFTDRITGTAWYSRDESRYENGDCRINAGNTCVVTNVTQPVWAANLQNIADSYGLGLRGKLSSKIDVGADFTEWKVRDEFNLSSAVPPNGIAVPLRTIPTKIDRFQLYGKYAIDHHSGVRLDYIFDQYRTDDWTWSRWIYSDGTTVMQDPNQKVNFVGVSYYYKFH